MPELPEVETISRQLREVLVGKKVREIRVLRTNSFVGNPEEMKGWEINGVERKAKVLEILFKGQEKMVICHLKMTGQLIFVDGKKRINGGHPTADWVKEMPGAHTRIIWFFEDGSKLFFNDMRVFGWMKMVSKVTYEKETRKSIPDVIDKDFTGEYLFNILKKSKKAIKLVLLDQDKIGGLGNIYVNDALYLAKVNPERKANSLTREEVEKVHKAAVEVINLGIKYGGASASNYVQVSGLGGTYQDHFLVYKKGRNEVPQMW